VDAVFSINFFPAVAEVCHVYHLSYLSWIVDSPVMELYTPSVLHDTNRIFIFDEAVYQEIAPGNPGCVFHLPLATNVRQKDELLAHTAPAKKKHFQADVSFIGSLYTEKSYYGRLKNASPYLCGYLEGLMNAQLKVYGYFFIEELLSDAIVSEFVEHFPGFYRLPGENFLSDRTTMAQLYLGTHITVMERDCIMKLLSEKYPVQIYTGSDTGAYPRLQNRGFANTLTEMPIIFHESKINLNPTAKSIRSGLSLRIWDILGSGGFCLTNYQAELPGLLPPGEYLDCYGSMEELDEKVAYYLSHEKERTEIAKNGYEYVRAHHTYPIRLSQMLQLAFADLMG
jgi:spore maturation protein CgeB